MAPAATVFDVSDTSTGDYRRGYRKFQLLGFVAATVVGVGTIAGLVRFALLSRLGALSSGTMIEIALLVATAALFLVLGVTNGPGAIRIEISTDALRLLYPSGRSRSFRWHDPRTVVKLYEFPAILPSGRPFPFSRFGVSTFRPQSNPLTQEAFDAILDVARDEELRIVKTDARIGTPRVRYRIFGSSRVVNSLGRGHSSVPRIPN